MPLLKDIHKAAIYYEFDIVLGNSKNIILRLNTLYIVQKQYSETILLTHVKIHTALRV